MFEILLYLFENYMENDTAVQLDHEALLLELEQAGFTSGEIDRALDWLDGLNRVQETVQSSPQLSSEGMRFYSTEEQEYLSVEIRGFFLYLEQLKILDPLTREIVIDRLMVLDPSEIDLGKVKWVVLIALFSQPDKKQALTLLQDLILSDVFGLVH